MKKLLLSSVAALSALSALSGAALAADLPYRRAAPAPSAYVAVPVFTWTGFYVGVNAGYGFDSGSVGTTGNQAVTQGNVANLFRAPSVSLEKDGFVGGGGVGYNWQMGALVLGAEADIQYTDLSKSVSYLSGRGDPSIYSSQLDYLGTVRGRIGYAMGQTLLYATGGLAYGEVTNGAAFFGFGPGNPLQFAGARSRVETGYTVGGGIEYLLPNMSLFNSDVTLKAEYLYYDLGDRNVTVSNVAGAGTSYNARFSNDGHLVRAGLNFKFKSY